MKNILINRQSINFTFVILIGILISSCNKNEIGPQGNYLGNFSNAETAGFFVINEGNFTFGNSSLSFVDMDNQHVSNNYYYNINDVPIGDVFQSLNMINNKYYLVVNNSQKIIVTDSTLNQTDTILSLDSPRYVGQVTSDKAYITDLYSDMISILDLNINQVIGNIPVTGWTEEMVVVENHVFVQEKENSKLLVVNSDNDQIENEILLSIGMSNMFVANDNSIWVLCDGGFEDPIFPKLFQIDSQSFSILQTFDFNTNESPPQFLSYNPTDDLLYYYQDGIKRMNLAASSLPATAFIEDEIDLVFGLDFDNINHVLVLSDAKDFVSQGEVFLYDTSGFLLNSFDVGVNPNGIFVKN